MKTLWRPIVSGVCMYAILGAVWAHGNRESARKVAFVIDAPTMEMALLQFTRQSGLQLLFSETAADVDAPRVVGEFTPTAALDQLLENSGLHYEFVADRTISIQSAASNVRSGTMRLAQAGPSSSAEGATAQESRSSREQPIPEVLIQGSQSLNSDIVRSRDDAQPYIIFDKAAIERSGALNITNFLADRLTAQPFPILTSQSALLEGNGSSISLRGLGPKQTLVLIDGHRMSSYTLGGEPRQPDLNGIPLSAVERIEVLPTTASGIYGGSATGGVINVVLRHDYKGVEVSAGYESPFRDGADGRRIDASGGLNFGDGKTNLIFAASSSNRGRLQVDDRDFLVSGREAAVQNNASGVFGSSSPLLGATTNIRSSNGTPLRLKNGTPLNSPVTFIPRGYTGSASDGGAALVANAGKYNLEPALTAQSGGGGYGVLLNGSEVDSLRGTLSHEFSSNIRGFVELSGSKNHSERIQNALIGSYTLPASAPNNPFAQSIRVTTPAVGADRLAETDIEERRGIMGVVVKLPKDWSSALDFTWSRTKIDAGVPGQGASANTAISTGALDVMRDTSVLPVDFSPYTVTNVNKPVKSTLKNAAVRFAGPTFRLPAGPVMVSTLVERREEDFSESISMTGQSGAIWPARGQSTNSFYVEASLPLVADHGFRHGPILEMQLAGRFDDYKTEGTNRIDIFNGVPTGTGETVEEVNRFRATKPTVGVRFRPLGDLMFRGSISEGFLPPSVSQLVPDVPFTYSGAIFDLTDPRRGNQQVGEFEYLTGGNPDLRPEDSTSYSLGVVLTPRHIVPGLRFSFDWTKIDKKNNLQTVATLSQQDLISELLVPGLIIRGPAAANDPFEVGPVIAINGQYINVARASVEAYDIALDYASPKFSFGSLQVSIGASKQVHNKTQATAATPWFDTVGLGSGGARWSANGQVTWSYADWQVGWSARYLGTLYFDTLHNVNLNTANNTFGDYVLNDLFASYRLPYRIPGSDSRVELQAGVQNLFGMKPDNTGSGNFYDARVDPRLSRYWLQLKMRFD